MLFDQCMFWFYHSLSFGVTKQQIKAYLKKNNNNNNDNFVIIMKPV